MINEFRDEMIREGFYPPQQIISDGEFHRFSTNQEKNDKAGWYILNDHPMIGSFGCWRRGIKKNWSVFQEKNLNSEDRSKYHKIIGQQKEKFYQEKEKTHLETALIAQRFFDKAREADPDHKYLATKKVEVFGIKQHEKFLPLFFSFSSASFWSAISKLQS